MKLPISALCLLLLATIGATAEPEFPLTEDSKPQPGVEKGQMLKGSYQAPPSSVFPGTEREYQIYLPAGEARPQGSPFMVFQDGVLYQAPVVFDNLIARKEIPPLIAIFIKPGVVPATNENALPRFNRSFEYDSISADYATFLIDEFLPEIEKRHGLTLSRNPDEAGISGNSSGGIAAFMVAWHRPDRFRRVFTGVGTYVGIRGADALPVFVRKTEPKPLRVFLQSGTGDNNIYCGDWWMANQMMERSLTWGGYEVDHVWGEGGHNQKHASQIFPDALRWLWKGWPDASALKIKPRGDSKWKGYEVFPVGTGWELCPETERSAMASPEERRTAHGQGQPLPLPAGATAAVLSPDQTLLYVAEPGTARVDSFQVTGGGALQFGQDFYLLDTWDADNPSGHGMCGDVEGRLYVATDLGVQVCDQAGRVNFIVPTPGAASDVCFGGAELKVLYVTCGDQIFKRPTVVSGVVSGRQPPFKPAAPKL
jgi:enterochelin esterase-like enzyme